MTKDDILNMPAGREMDALVAVELFGLSLEHLLVLYEEGNTEDGLDGWSGFVCPHCRLPQDMLDEPCAKHYSEDIAAAWEVAVGSGIMVRPSILAGKWVAAKFERVYLSGKWEGNDEVTADTAPLAICKVALIERLLNNV